MTRRLRRKRLGNKRNVVPDGRLQRDDPERSARGWRSLRPKFASDLMNQPLKVLCQLGGWKSVETVLECSQHADATELLEARRTRVAGA